MRALIAAVLATAACGGYPMIQNLPLRWRGVDTPVQATVDVAAALTAIPLNYGLRDLRLDATAVGTMQNENGFVVRTRDNVAQYCSQRFGELLRTAGARLDEQPAALLQIDLIEYRVDEGGTFSGTARLRITVLESDVDRDRVERAWTKVYTGTSKRWGRTHNPENFNEALSNAFADAVRGLLRDAEFAAALTRGSPRDTPYPPGPAAVPGPGPAPSPPPFVAPGA